MDTTLQILEKVDTFYNHSFTILMYLTGLIFTLGGIAMPLILRYIESKRSNEDREILKTQITNETNMVLTQMKNQFDELVKSQANQIQDDLKGEVVKLEEESKRIESRLSGGILLQQGKYYADKADYSMATINLSSASLEFFKGGYESMGLNAIGPLIFNMKGLDQKHIARNIEIGNNLIALISYLESINQDERYSVYITDLAKGYEEAKTNTD